MRKANTQFNFLVMKDVSYVKRYNVTEDTSVWEGRRIEAITIWPSYKKIIMINLRRKFIPPFLESYSDFIIICELDLSDLNENNFLLYKDYNDIKLLKNLEIIADSLHCQCSPNVLDFVSIIDVKIDSLTLHTETMYYITNILKLKGFDCYILGNIFIIKIMKGILLDYSYKTNSKYVLLERYYSQYINYFVRETKELINKQKNLNIDNGGKTFAKEYLERIDRLADNSEE
jgi:hypothetical protein